MRMKWSVESWWKISKLGELEKEAVLEIRDSTMSDVISQLYITSCMRHYLLIHPSELFILQYFGPSRWLEASWRPIYYHLENILSGTLLKAVTESEECMALKSWPRFIDMSFCDKSGIRNEKVLCYQRRERCKFDLHSLCILNDTFDFEIGD